MFRTTLCAVAFSAASFSTYAVETLDVLVVYDKNTISNVSELNSSKERSKYATQLIVNLNKTFNNSGLSSHIQFRLKKQGVWPVSQLSNGKRESIIQMGNRYESYINDMINNGNPKGTAYILQNAYKADTVIVVTKEGNISGKIGWAVSIPNKKHIDSNLNTHDKLVGFGGYGLFFISAEKIAFENNLLVAHEFGHTAGLYHGPTDSTYNTYKKQMLVLGASGYKHIASPSSNFSTAMIPGSEKAHVQENLFSNKDDYGCGHWNLHYCGTSEFNAVDTLKKFASAYNKRGYWYSNN